VAEMSAHKFKIGQFVNYSPRLKVGAGVYQIAQLMPPAGDVPQYRINSSRSQSRRRRHRPSSAPATS